MHGAPGKRYPTDTLRACPAREVEGSADYIGREARFGGVSLFLSPALSGEGTQRTFLRGAAIGRYAAPNPTTLGVKHG